MASPCAAKPCWSDLLDASAQHPSGLPLCLDDIDHEALQLLCGAGNRILHRIETYFRVSLLGQPGNWVVQGEKADAAVHVLGQLADQARQGRLTDAQVEQALRSSHDSAADAAEADRQGNAVLSAGRRQIRGKTPNQRHYLETIRQCTLTLAIGPAGSGKTYLAVASAVASLSAHEVERIILTRPAVEAGERLGFLPGDMQQKVDPYLRPLFDALAEMLGLDKMNTMMESGRIEIAPLAYMRGRTLSDAFVILDEAQNTTRAQMKMFLTRLGFASKMVVTGDVTQVDLEHKHASGLLHALQVLEGVESIGICRLTGRDVIRHPLVEHIVSAYERAEANNT